MVLVDDNYASIVAAVEEGRGVYDNVQKFVNYLLSSNIGEVFTIFFSIFLFPVLPLQALQILWVNLATDGLPAIALGVDPVSKDVMKRKPAAKDKKILDRNTIMFLLPIGLTIAIGTLSIFWIYLPKGEAYARTMAFTALVVFELVNVFSCRTNYSLFKEGIFRNKYLLAAVSCSLVLQAVILYTPLSSVFNTVPIAFADWMVIGAASSSVFIMAEIVKKRLNYRIID